VQQQIFDSLNNFLPETALTITLIATIFADLIIKRKSAIVSVIAIIGLIVTSYFVYAQWTAAPASIFYGMMAVDPYAAFFKFLFILSTFYIILFALSSKEIKDATHKNEHVPLMLSLTLGAFLMASSINLLMMYLSLELASLTSYILAGYTKKDKRSSEAAMKYIIYGAASSGIMIYAISLLYGLTGSVNVFDISRYLAGMEGGSLVITMSILMIMAGIGYKISSVPFHFWTPDVYEGAPIPVTAFLAVTSSAAGFSILIRFFASTFTISLDAVNGNWQLINGVKWVEIIIVLSVASMVVGNFVAVWQTSLKRLLAYSSIAQAGYIMLGLVVANQTGMNAMFIYLIAYLFMNLGAFYIVILISNKLNSDDINDMKGLGYRAPFICVAMTVFMIALAGIPGTVGFIGKFYLFSALVQNGSNTMLWVAFIGLLNSVVSLFFYIKVIKYMFLMRTEEGADSKIQYGFGYYIVVLMLVIPTIAFGIYFYPLIRIAEKSSLLFFIK